MQGWECPRCHAVMAPDVDRCVNCKGGPAPAPAPPTIPPRPPRPPGAPYPWPRPYGPIWGDPFYPNITSGCFGSEV